VDNSNEQIHHISAFSLTPHIEGYILKEQEILIDGFGYGKQRKRGQPLFCFCSMIQRNEQSSCVYR